MRLLKSLRRLGRHRCPSDCRRVHRCSVLRPIQARCRRAHRCSVLRPIQARCRPNRMRYHPSPAPHQSRARPQSTRRCRPNPAHPQSTARCRLTPARPRTPLRLRSQSHRPSQCRIPLRVLRRTQPPMGSSRRPKTTPTKGCFCDLPCFIASVGNANGDSLNQSREGTQSAF
jgi:hypothetical protein